MLRVGQGFDVHKFASGNSITIGGVSITHDQGLDAHSDGDVLLHALIDAILGAAAMGDIGHLFPDNDDQWKDANSRELLKGAWKIVREKGYTLNNADMTLIAQVPKFAPHISAMRANIASDLEVKIDQINVKATTTEGVGFTGRKEGIAAQAVVLLSST